MLRPVVYDTAALAQAGRARGPLWHRHRGYLLAGGVPCVPAAAVVAVWRDRATRAGVTRLLRGCVVVPLDDALAREVGELLDRAGPADPADAAVALLAVRLRAVVPTPAPDPLAHLLACLGPAGAGVSVTAA